jgi:hypothetical protein
VADLSGTNDLRAMIDLTRKTYLCPTS